MADLPRTRGACAYCARQLTRSPMARHLASCPARAEAVAAADGGQGPVGRFVHLQVEDAGSGTYWLQLEIDGGATMKQLDRYLRAIWLECCGHLSRFSSGGWSSPDIPMSRRVAAVLQPGVELVHVYDFGSQSVTRIAVKGVREGRSTVERPIALMARNEEPVYPCQECGAPSERLCMECVYENELPGTLCQLHADEHPYPSHGDSMPLVNSPRVGVCGYEGPADPPY